MRSLRKLHSSSKNICAIFVQPHSNYSIATSDYLERSYLPTYHFQGCLPRLPVPKLEDTMQKYILSLRALEGYPSVDQQSIKDTERAVKSFLLNEGPELQRILVAQDEENPSTSYIVGPWFDMYLESRLPLPLNFNPFMMFKRDRKDDMNEQATRATNLIASAMRFKKSLEEEILSPEVFYMSSKAKSPLVQKLVRYLPNAMMLRYLPMMKCGAYPLDMSQFINLFSSTRIPQPSRDELATFPESRHVTVLRNGHFYTVRTLNDDGTIASPQAVNAAIRHILEDRRPPPDHAVAYMSTCDRDVWARARQHLVSTGNAEALQAIDSGIFCMVLEEAEVETEDECVRTFLFGDGASRWFDKSFSLIVAGNGDTAVNFEHAWGDGVAVVRFFNDVFYDSTRKPAFLPADARDNLDVTDYVTRVEFNLDDKAKQSICDAKHQYRDVTNRIRIAAGQTQNLNKQYLKDKKVSPDGILQLAIQTGHFKMMGHPAPTYESCSTAAFKHGRTETIRSCTLEAQRAAKAIALGTVNAANNRLASDSEYRSHVESLIRKSCDKHNELTRNAAMGHGFDRHMFALRELAVNRLKLTNSPGLFRDPCYAAINHIVLSTSTLSSDAISFGGFGPVVPDGFGIGYGVRDELVGCNITSYDVRDVQALVDAILSAFDDIYTVFER